MGSIVTAVTLTFTFLRSEEKHARTENFEKKTFGVKRFCKLLQRAEKASLISRNSGTSGCVSRAVSRSSQIKPHDGSVEIEKPLAQKAQEQTPKAKQISVFLAQQT